MNITEIKALQAALIRAKAQFESCPLPDLMVQSAKDSGASDEEAEQVRREVKGVFKILFEHTASAISRAITTTSPRYTQRDQDVFLRSLGIGPCSQCEGTGKVAGQPCQKCG